MSDTLQEHADPTLTKGESLIRMVNVGKTYGAIRALKGINMTVNAGEVACVSVHGSNRLGTNSLLDINVFGKRAGVFAARVARRLR